MRSILKKRLLIAICALLAVLPLQWANAFNLGSLTNGIPTTLTLVAAGKKVDMPAGNYTTGNNTFLSNGSYWYWRQLYSFGYSPNSTVNIDATQGYDICASSLDSSCSPGSGMTRLSFKMNSSTVLQGGRIGSRINITTGDAARMCFYASTQPSYFPSGIQRNVSVSTITSGGWTKNAESYFRATSYTDQAMLYCLGNGTAVANFFMVGAFDPTATNVLSFSPRSTTSSDGSITYDLQFSEAVSGLTSSDFTASGTGSSSCSVGAPSGSGANYVVTLSGCTAGTVNLALNANAVTGSVTGPAVTETAVTVTVVEIATTISLAITDASSVIYKGIPFELTATVSQPGTVTFTANGKRIGTCVSKVAASTTAICNWRPAVQGPVVLKVSLKPANSSYTASSSLNIVVATQKRTTTR
jgi:hypothetical protein